MNTYKLFGKWSCASLFLFVITFAISILSSQSALAQEDCDAEFVARDGCSERGAWQATLLSKSFQGGDHSWTLFETETYGATTGGQFVTTLDGDDFVFIPYLDRTKHFYVEHVLEGGDCIDTDRQFIPERFTTVAVSEETTGGIRKEVYCSDDNIYLNTSGSSGQDRFFIAIYRAPLGTNNFAYYTQVPWNHDPMPTLIDLSTSVSKPLFSGFSYRVTLATMNPGECRRWTTSTAQFIIDDSQCSTMCDTPLNVLFECDEGLLSWDNIAGANSYTIRLVYNDGDFCSQGRERVVTLTSSVNLLPVPYNPEEVLCFSAQVVANCDNGPSLPSAKEYFQCEMEPRATNRVDSNIEFSVSPNPAKSKAVISNKSEFDVPGVLTIYSKEGELTEQIPTKSNSTIEIDVSQYRSGMYFFNFSSEKGVTEMQKLVVVN